MNKIPSGFLSEHPPLRTEKEVRGETLFINVYQHTLPSGRQGGKSYEAHTDQLRAMNDARWASDYESPIVYVETIVLNPDHTWTVHQYAPEGE